VDFAASLRMFFRRWYITFPLAALTAVAALYAARSVEPSYQATGTVVLLAPVSRSTTGVPAPADRNPYLRFDKNLEVVAGLMATVLTSPRMQERLREAGATGSYDVGTANLGVSPQNASPLVQITATGPDGPAAERTVAVVAHYLSIELARRQRAAGAPADSLIRTQVTTPPTVTGRIVGSTSRAVGATVVLGLAVTLGAGSLVELLASRRKRRRRGARRGKPEHSIDLREESGAAPPTSVSR
jgi:hypothetical protein